MSLRVFGLAPVGILIGSAPFAAAANPIETQVDLESTVVILPISESDSRIETEPVTAEISLNALTETILDNGVRLRARGALRLQRDHPSRPSGLGGFGSDAIAPVGAFSGLSLAEPKQDSQIRSRLETAYLQVDGGYGEVRLGKDQGVGARFYEGPKSILSHARLDSTLLDPTGLNTVRSRHDLTGPSLKASYASPRLLGVRGGVSFTPKADADGLDRQPASGTGGLSPETENALELALNGTRRLTESGLRFDIGLAWSQADVTNRLLPAEYSAVETWSAGTRIERDDWTLGASWLESNNGLPSSTYSAWSAGIHKNAYETDFSIELGESKDDGIGLDARSFRVGAARDLGPSMRLALAYLNDETRLPGEIWESQGVVVEITLSQEILQVTGN